MFYIPRLPYLGLGSHNIFVDLAPITNMNFQSNKVSGKLFFLLFKYISHVNFLKIIIKYQNACRAYLLPKLYDYAMAAAKNHLTSDARSQ